MYLVSPSSVAGLSSTLNGEVAYFRLRFNLYLVIHTYIKPATTWFRRLLFLKTDLCRSPSLLLPFFLPPLPFSPTSLPFLIALCPSTHIVERNRRSEDQTILPQAEAGHTHSQMFPFRNVEGVVSTGARTQCSATLGLHVKYPLFLSYFNES